MGDGVVHLIASDAHTTKKRNPVMSDALPSVESALGKEEAMRLVYTRPQAILDNMDPAQVPPVPGLLGGQTSARGMGKAPWYKRLWK